LIVLAALAAATFRDYGPTWDEGSQRQVGRAVVAWYASGFQDRGALEPGPMGNYHLYGGLFDGPAELAALALPFDPFDVRHLLNALTALAGLLGTGLLARRLAGGRAAFLAVALLAATGAWWGHGFSNPKDIPFAAAMPWMLLTLLGAADASPGLAPGRLAAAGLALGAGFGVRPAGLLLLLPLAAGAWGARGLPHLLAQPAAERPSAALRLIGGFGLVVLVAWPVMLAAWPWGQLGPLTRPFVAASETAASVQPLAVHFAGTWATSTGLPWSYLPRWLLATLPETWLLAAPLACWGPAGRWSRATEEKRIDLLVVAGAALLPVAAALLTQPPLYDGLRHFLFVLPPLASALAAGVSLALDRLPRPAARAAAGMLGAAWLVAVGDLAALHPYQSVYFNRLVAGGVSRGTAEFEGDYWATSVGEGVRWILQAPSLRGRRLAVAFDGPPFLVEHAVTAAGADGRIRLAEAWGADLYIATTRLFAHRAPGRVLHVVERMGAPLLYVIAPFPPALAGPRRLEAGDLTVDLPLPAGWFVEPNLTIGDRRTRFSARSKQGAEVELVVATPAAGPVASAEGLRTEAITESRRLGLGGGDPERLAGPAAEGWCVRRRHAIGRGEQVVGAVRTGSAVVSFRARGAPDDVAALLEGLAAARQGPPPDRLP
jgi:hypothetical protein